MAETEWDRQTKIDLLPAVLSLTVAEFRRRVVAGTMVEVRAAKRIISFMPAKTQPGESYVIRYFNLGTNQTWQVTRTD